MQQEEQLRAKDLNQQGMALLRAGNTQAAAERFARAIEEDPMVADSYRNLGELAMRTGNYAEAKDQYRKALLIEKSGEVYFQYGSACFMNDEPHEGLKNYNLAISSGFDNDEMLFFMGLAYEHLNDDRMALRYVQKAMQKNPSRPDYKVKKVNLLVRLNMKEEAKSSVDEILQDDPELYDGYHLKTMLLVREGSYKEAADFAGKAFARFPKDGDLLFDYANASALSGDSDGALKLLQSAKRMPYYEEQRDKFTLLEAEVLARKQDVEGAKEKCREAITLETPETFHPEAHFLLINLSLSGSDYETALKESELLIARDQKDAYYYAALYYRPFCMKQMGLENTERFYRDAIAAYRLATLKNPSAVEAYLYRAMCLKDLAEYNEALELLDFMETLDSRIAEIYSIRADIYHLLGQKEMAAQQIRKAVSYKPELQSVLAPAAGEG